MARKKQDRETQKLLKELARSKVWDRKNGQLKPADLTLKPGEKSLTVSPRRKANAGLPYGFPDRPGPRSEGQRKAVERFHTHPAFAAHKWQKGKSGNPAGRPKRPTFTEVFYRILQRELKPEHPTYRKLKQLFGVGLEELSPMTQMEAICYLLVHRALGGDLEAFDRMADRIDPKPRRVEIDANVAQRVAAAVITKDMPAAEAAAAYSELTRGDAPLAVPGEDPAPRVEEAPE